MKSEFIRSVPAAIGIFRNSLPDSQNPEDSGIVTLEKIRKYADFRGCCLIFNHNCGDPQLEISLYNLNPISFVQLLGEFCYNFS